MWQYHLPTNIIAKANKELGWRRRRIRTAVAENFWTD